MPRRRLHHSKADQREATRLKHAKYYLKHCDSIKSKNLASYYRNQKESQKSKASSRIRRQKEQKEVNRRIEEDRALHFKKLVNLSKERYQHIENSLKPSPQLYFDALCKKYLKFLGGLDADSSTIFDKEEQRIMVELTTLEEYMTEIAQEFGYIKEFNAVEAAAGKIRQILNWVIDLQASALSSNLQRMYSRRMLMYQREAW